MSASFRGYRVRAVIAKEWREMRRNRPVVATALFVPMFQMVIAVGALLTLHRLPAGDGRGVQLPPGLQGRVANANEAVTVMIAQLCLTLFLLMPAMIPSILAAHAVVGEKTLRTLEPLLATPLRTSEFVIGKMIACVVPGVLPAWFSYAAYLALIVAIEPPHLAAMLATGPWVFTAFVIGPLLSVFSVCLGMIISSRVNDVQSAQGLAGLVGLPIVATAIANITGFLLLSMRATVTAALVLAAVDALVVALAVRLFARETILTRWR
ncbi:MAG: ABC transporter permease subunit [Deltaproteobacteria bacterium]